MSDSTEQGFNDQELADIMSEIESLEQDYEEVEKHTDETPIVAAVEEAKVDVSPVVAVEEPAVEVPANVMPIKPQVKHSVPSQHTSMSFNVEGEMKLQLKFCVNGQEIALAVDPLEGFVIELAGGAVFKVPIAHKKVA